MAFADENRQKARAIIVAVPAREVGGPAAAHLAQEQDGWVSPDAISEVAELVGVEPAEVLGTCSFYTMFKREPVRQARRVGVHERLVPRERRSRAARAPASQRYAADDDVHVEEVECLAACDTAPVLQVNYEFHEQLHARESRQSIVEYYKRGELTARTVSGSAWRMRS